MPNGIPGVETRLPILFSEGVNGGRIDISVESRIAESRDRCGIASAVMRSASISGATAPPITASPRVAIGVEIARDKWLA